MKVEEGLLAAFNQGLTLAPRGRRDGLSVGQHPGLKCIWNCPSKHTDQVEVGRVPAIDSTRDRQRNQAREYTPCMKGQVDINPDSAALT